MDAATQTLLIELVEQKSEGLIGITASLMMLFKALSPEDFKIFYENSLDGEKLWDDFKSRRDDPDAPADYDFISYAKSIISDNQS